MNKSPRGYLVKDLVAGQNYPISQSFGNFGPYLGFAAGGISERGDIYFPAHSSQYVLKLNRNSRSTSLIGSVSTNAQKYGKFCRSPQGNLYAPPWYTVTNQNILKLNPNTDTVTTFDNTYSGTTQFGGFILAPNGFMYGIPFSAGSILKLNPANDQVTTVSTPGPFLTQGAALATNGKIYCIPYTGTTIYVIDPSNDTVYNFGTFTAGAKWEGAVLGMNGKIYGLPSMNSSNTYIEVDPENDTFKTFSSVAGNMYLGSLAPNGKIYGAPETSPSSVIEIDTRLQKTRNIQITGPTGVIGWHGLVMGHNGWLYGAPHISNRILEISRVGQVTPEMYTMPSDISTLSTSLYNKFYNNV